MDPADVGVWVCGYVHEHVGFPDVVEDVVGYRERDGAEFGEGEVVDGWCVWCWGEMG